MSSTGTPEEPRPVAKYKLPVRRAKTCTPKTKRHRKTFYFTTGGNIDPENLKELEKAILRPYRPPSEIKTMKDVRRFWEEEKSDKKREREDDFRGHHNHRSRLNLLWKRERLFVEEDTKLPGKSITDDIDPNFFTIVSGKPIKIKQDVRTYLKDIRECFLTRLKTGYYVDEILLMDQKYVWEKKMADKVKKNFQSCSKAFEEFLTEDHESSAALLETAKVERETSRQKEQLRDKLRDELKNIEADVLVVEEKWRNCKMFQKFLYVTAPSEWRRIHDPHYGREDLGVGSSDPCLFDSFREFPGETKIDLNTKILKFKEDIKEEVPPALFFSHPQQLLDILEDLERNNLMAFAHSNQLCFPAQQMAEEVKKTRKYLEEDQKQLEEEKSYLENLVKAEEEKAKENEEKLKEIAFGFFRDLITNEEYLSVTAWVEDVFEDAVAPNDHDLSMVDMMKAIEAKQESLLLDLDLLPNDVMVRTTRMFFREQRTELEEAKEAERKVHQMNILLKRLSNALESPKKKHKERKLVQRSFPPEELMFKFKLPKILTKEERDYLFFFGETEDAKIHKPLCP